MNKKTTHIAEFNADDDWFFTSELSEASFCGSLDYCLEMAKDWHNPAERTIKRARKRCLLLGSFKMSMWQINYDVHGTQKAIERMLAQRPLKEE
ncbi:hypothetical protein BZZ01_32825 (plasmid) [Nostocales cyanobacterium HT-58-2]|nr:hypothetical protein BZZ01_32825 [Nostocales cyanobacterium HT-58-2]